MGSQQISTRRFGISLNLIAWIYRGSRNFVENRWGTNSTFAIIIPKESNPQKYSRFRPISICNVSYKIFPKIIANRIKSIIVKIIFKEPGFMPNQSIFENIIVNEMKDNNNTKKTEIQWKPNSIPHNSDKHCTDTMARMMVAISEKRCVYIVQCSFTKIP